MILQSIVLVGFRNFTGFNLFDFSKLTLVKGKNGKGKSTLCKNAILFALYGYSEQKLEQLPNKHLETPKCNVQVEIKIGDDLYKIQRFVPTNIKVWKNDIELKLAKAEYQNFINETFGTREQFIRFRLIDHKEGTQLLDRGDNELKRTLLSLDQTVFNAIRSSLVSKKSQREQFNKDKLKVSSHYPSFKRLQILDKGIQNNKKQIAEKEEEVQLALNKLRPEIEKSSTLQYKTDQAHKHINWINGTSSCPTCKNILTPTYKTKLIAETNKLLVTDKKQLSEVLLNKKALDDELKMLRESTTLLRASETELGKLKTKLEQRIDHKDFKFTSRDVLVMKKAIDHLDSFYGFYLKEQAKNLEPLVNHVIAPLKFMMELQTSDKGDLVIKLTKDDKSYQYNDLSTGQRLILTLAFQVAIMLQHQQTGLIIADEGFSSLDEENLQLVIELFRQVPFQLVCVVHRFQEIPKDVEVIDLNV